MPPRLPGIDPEILLILAAIGAVVGAISTTVTYVAFRIAESEGRRLNILPEFPPFLEQQES